MSVLAPTVIESDNLSHAWGEALLRTRDFTNQTISPLVIAVAGFQEELPREDDVIRAATDETLLAMQKNPVRVSAMTIFPFASWERRGRPDVSEFSPFCVERLLPRMKALDQRNRLGTYFERLMGYSGWRGNGQRTINQLEFVIQLLRDREREPHRWPRQSALQMSCFDPAKDHTGQPVRGFPCLQQVGVTHDGGDRIAINAYYPTQYIFDRGYGNYLGLCHLGAFIAHETGLRFTRLNCFVGRPERGAVSKTAIGDLCLLIERQLDQQDETQGAAT